MAYVYEMFPFYLILYAIYEVSHNLKNQINTLMQVC